MSRPNALFDAIRAHAAARPFAVALEDDAGARLTYGHLLPAIAEVERQLVRLGAGAVAVVADNSVGAALVDLAALGAGIPFTALPQFQSDEQIASALESFGVNWLATDDSDRARRLLGGTARMGAVVAGLAAFGVPVRRTVERPAERATFTSGTTGRPKGVCLEPAALARTSAALVGATGIGPTDRHLGLLPHGVLLESVGGLYRALLAGAATVLPRLRTLGLDGATSADPMVLARGIARHGATTAILVPALLEALLDAVERGGRADLRRLRFLGVGGAVVRRELLERAAAIGLPVFQGYGLSEAGSVVALETVAARRRGSVGKPLRHVAVAIAPGGEIAVSGDLFRGYLGDATPRAVGAPIATGDLGHLDADGFLFVSGRAKNVIITSFGRNLSPEWVEAELVDGRAIADACVFGDGRARPAALVVASASRAEVVARIRSANARLPDYARIDAFACATEPFLAGNGLATANGRLRRAAILERHRGALAHLEPVSALTESEVR